jgi:hypothetical protein
LVAAARSRSTFIPFTGNFVESAAAEWSYSTLLPAFTAPATSSARDRAEVRLAPVEAERPPPRELAVLGAVEVG